MTDRAGATTAPTSGGSIHRRDLQGLRGVAVLLVVLYHAGEILPGGYLGVDVFFVLSGFLIGGLLVREFTETGRIDLATFFTRRVRRLLPALAMVTSVTLLLAVLVLDAWSSLPQAVATGASASLFAANAQLYLAGDYFAPAAELNPLLHTWSLSVEEQFYVALPLLLLLVATLRRGRSTERPFLATVMIGLAASFLLALLLTSPGTDGFLFLTEPRRLAFFAPFTRAWQFLAGVALAIITHGVALGRERRNLLRRTPRFLAPAIQMLGLVAVLGASVVVDGTTRWPGPATLVPVIGTVAIIAAGVSATPGQGWAGIGRVLNWGPLVRAGDLSYSWYLWHWPAIVIARESGRDSAAVLLIAALLSLIPAWWSYRFIEERFRRDRSMVGRRVLRLAIASIAIPLLLASLAEEVGARGRASAAAAGTLNARLADEARIAAAAIEDASSSTGPRELVIVGDSHAGALGQGLAVELALLDDAPTFGMLVRPGCLFLTGITSDSGCGYWQDKVLAELMEEDVRTVVITGFATGRVTGERRGERTVIDLFDAQGRRFEDPAAALDAYGSALDRVVEDLTGAGRRVVIVSPVPDFTTDLTSGVSAAQALLGIDAGEVLMRPIPVADARRRAEPFLAAAQAIAGRHPGTQVLDPIPVLCATECRQIVDGVPLYRDHDHLSLAGARLLARAVLELIP